MSNNLLVRMIGFSATLLHGDPMVLDRWRWLKSELSGMKKGRLIDIGCGSGSFSLGAGKLGFNALGLSWDKENQDKASERADLLGLKDHVQFAIQDVRFLDERKEYDDAFDAAICTENIEHIINDTKLMTDISRVLRPGGILLLTTPNYNYIPIGIGDSKDMISEIEDGRHVRIGYTPEDCIRQSTAGGFDVVRISYCSGYFSQKISGWFRRLIEVFGYKIAWLFIFPMRILPIVFDPTIEKFFKWPGYSICLVAKKK